MKKKNLFVPTSRKAFYVPSNGKNPGRPVKEKETENVTDVVRQVVTLAGRKYIIEKTTHISEMV